MLNKTWKLCLPIIFSRVGYAGEDFPKSEIPAWVGTSPDNTESADPNAMDTGTANPNVIDTGIDR